MPKRVAITIAGAVSLGSYEAGVMYELLEAFRLHNEAAKSDDGKIYVDAITGASAGGMTAAMLAQWLMFRGASMSDADTNPLHHAWVERISLEGLVKLQKKENKWHSLFSSDLITQIGNEMLVASMSLPMTGPHACVEPGAPLRVGIALTNLNGINYMIPIEGSQEEGFNYTRSADQRLFTVKPGSADGPVLVTPEGVESAATWDDLRAVAVACGAFPFAFRPQQIQRNADEYVNSVTPEWKGIDHATTGTTYVTLPDPATETAPVAPWDFSYTDGGVLQNQPLGIAKDLVDASVGERLKPAKARVASLRTHAVVTARDQAVVLRAENELGKIHRDADDRVYVFVSPNEVKSSSEDLVASAISLSKMLPDVMGVYMRQATFHDWIMAEGVNQKIKLLDERAEQLAGALQNGAISDIAGFRTAAENLDRLLLGAKQEDALERLRHQYHVLYDGLVKDGDDTKARAFVEGIAALEAAAHLDDRDKMHIIAVLADGKKELAGAGLSAFVGFFSRTFRQHDYLVGRQKARAYLLRADVANLLQLDVPALTAYFKEHPMVDPATLVAVPLSLTATLLAGGRWLFHAVWIRFSPLLVLLALVPLALVYAGIAESAHWWPW